MSSKEDDMGKTTRRTKRPPATAPASTAVGGRKGNGEPGRMRARPGAAPPELVSELSPAAGPSDAAIPGYYGTEALDRAFKANLARFTNGISPAGMAAIYFDWLAHLVISPGKQAELIQKAARKGARLALYAGEAATKPETPP